MNTDTPETDNLARGNYVAHPTVWSILRKLERERDEAREQRDRLAEALQKLADCDWEISLANRMDAVRTIARDALQSLTPNNP